MHVLPVRRDIRPVRAAVAGPAPPSPWSTLIASLALGACDAGAPAVTPRITPGTSSAPREVNIIARDYAYVPPTVDLVPGETVILHVINGGLEIHEAIVGDMKSQLAWEAAEEATVGHPPGPTPFVPDPAGFDGVRVVVGSGQRLDVTWTVPVDAASAARRLVCRVSHPGALGQGHGGARSVRRRLRRADRPRHRSAVVPGRAVLVAVSVTTRRVGLAPRVTSAAATAGVSRREARDVLARPPSAGRAVVGFCGVRGKTSAPQAEKPDQESIRT